MSASLTTSVAAIVFIRGLVAVDHEKRGQTSLAMMRMESSPERYAGQYVEVSVNSKGAAARHNAEFNPERLPIGNISDMPGMDTHALPHAYHEAANETQQSVPHVTSGHADEVLQDDFFLSCFNSQQVIRFLVIGDSMVQGDGDPSGCGFRCRLWQDLSRLTGYKIEMIGSQIQGPAHFPEAARRHEGYNHWRMDVPGFGGKLQGILERNTHPDFILSEIGENELVGTICRAGGPANITPDVAASTAFQHLKEGVVERLCQLYPQAQIAWSVVIPDNRTSDIVQDHPACGVFAKHGWDYDQADKQYGRFVRNATQRLNSLIRDSPSLCDGTAHVIDWISKVQFCSDEMGCRVHPDAKQYEEWGAAYASLIAPLLLKGKQADIQHQMSESPYQSSADMTVARAILGTLVLMGTLAVGLHFIHRDTSRATHEGPGLHGATAASRALQFRYLNGLRFPATAWVIAFHFAKRDETLQFSPWENFIIKGRWAITFFFILSGFAVHSSWREDDSSKAFLARRLTRLLLSYYGAVLFWMFLRSGPCWEWKAAPVDVNDVVLFLLMMQTWPIMGGHQYKVNGPAWFIASALLSYVTYPYWRRFIVRRSLWSLCAILAWTMWIVPAIFTSVALYFWWTDGIFRIPHDRFHWMYTWPPLCFIEFLSGCLISQVAQILTRAHTSYAQESDDVLLVNVPLSTVLGHFGDFVFACVICYVLLVGRSMNDCASWAEDGCATGWIASQCCAPVLTAIWVLLTSMPVALARPGCIVQVLQSKVLTSKLFVQPTLAMFVLQDSVAMLLARAGVLSTQVEMRATSRTGGRALSPLYLSFFLIVVWIVSWLWSSMIEERACKALIKAPE